MDRVEFKTSPLYRLEATYMDDLARSSDKIDDTLAESLRDRLSEAEAKRDNNLKSLIVIDAILSIALSGKGFTIPVVNLSTAELPAIMEILVGLASLSICICSLSFTTWLTYSTLLTAVLNKGAKAQNMNGGLLRDAFNYNEVGLRLFQHHLALGGDELLEPQRTFRWVVRVYEIATSILFALIPIMHILLVAYGLVAIYESSGVSVLHSLLFVAVFIGHLLAILFWFVPMREFKFFLLLRKKSPDDAI
ncbi:hypothetical protein [Agrobacterium rosae]|uniref:hypothetical protein n=1 Tax=Agrobacterium rosae TaxID=1972867 RepID=UPI0020346E8F|nr:hypothetical protein [Agrobacterium rosae]MCM2434144.1 hypothetical protein [Agrobacterium rosae]